MTHQELLRDLTESYLKSVISEASDSLRPDFDSFAPFGELGVNSFGVLKIIKKLEVDFGTLPKSLLFENFTVNDLAGYFVSKHEPTVSAKFAQQLQGIHSLVHTNGHSQNHVEVLKDVTSTATGQANPTTRKTSPIRILEKEAYAHPELQELVQTLFERYKIEGCVSRGTRKIAPNLFIGSERRGFFNYGRSKNIILLYGYTGPREYLPALLEEIYQYCEANRFQLNILADEEIPPIGGRAFSATPFGALQRILNLKEFSLDGGPMRRLRYQVSKFEKNGIGKTEEYKCGSNQETDKKIVSIIDQWSESGTMVNPLVYDVRSEILAGTLHSDHRLFLTYLDGILQNVILITPMCSQENGYLMDLEFYPHDMPMGGLEFAIVEIIKVLVAEACDVLSLGGTYGCKLNPCANADAEIDKILDELREQNIFNDGGNLQFKNKFRPENKAVFLCRPMGSDNPGNVIDIIMMIADPVKMQTSDEENHNFGKEQVKKQVEVAAVVKRPMVREASTEALSVASEQLVIDGNTRSRILADAEFNPLNISHEHIEFDLKTDSWAQLHIPAIETQMRHLHSQLQQTVSLEENLRAVFPFAHFVITLSGQAAENIFFKAWQKKGVVLQNLLFPSTIFHQIDKGFSPKELPHPAVFHLNSEERYKGDMDWEALQAQVAQDAGAIACVCIEVSDNAAGGHPVSIQHLKDAKALLAQYSIPLVIDGTRVVENAQLLIEQEKEYAGKSVWKVVREIFSYADAVIGSLTKDFCVNKGGIIATNDVQLFLKLQQLVHEEGTGLDLIDKKMIALSLENRKQIETKVLRRMEAVRLIWQALKDHNIPVVQPAGGHCILINVKQIPEFKDFSSPVASFVAWLYLNTGIRAAAHSVGMQKNTSINDLVRLAIPVGLKQYEVESVISRLIHAFDRKVNIPEVVMESNAPQSLGAVYAKYKLLNYHNASEEVFTKADITSSVSEKQPTVAPLVASGQLPVSSKPPQVPSSREIVVAENDSRETKSSKISMNGKSRPTKKKDIAIVGMAGRYPKAKNLKELWENLAQGRDCIDDLPAERYEARLRHGSPQKYRGGFIDDIDRFDSLFFNISPREAEMLDPQERLFLEVAWEAIEDAGYYPEILAQENTPRNIGVFVGAVWAMYQMLAVEEKNTGNKIVPNSFLWGIANRVSYCFNLSGPSLTIDTACSSSLTAMYLACEAIQAGECSATIVGGVNLDIHQAKFDINWAGGALSPDGVCRTFGKGANGYVAGEGIGALFLKPLEQAVQDRDNIYGVIKSAVVNHGGRTSGYTVPNPKAQSSLILAAFEKANIGARTVGYIEAHGTGTELGDPIEITGLTNVFSADNVDKQTCAIGSIKSNIGHLEAAAGVVSVSKVLLQMKHRQLAPSLHSAELNEFIDFQSSPFYVVQRAEEWKAKEVDGVPLPLRAGISSFGAGGANAHIILENYEPAEKANEAPAQVNELIFPLSAKNEEQLRDAAVRLAKFVQECRESLADIAYTLQMGRKSFEHRLAIIAKTKDDLLEKLNCFIEGKKTEEILLGHVKSGENITRLLGRKEKEEFIRLLLQGREPNRIAELWTEGLLTDWQGVQSSSSGKRISLPTYPFADKRHWAHDKSQVRQALQLTSGVHPMVDSNESTFERQIFKKTFHDRDFFIYDHHVANIPTLPGVAYLEFARKAGELAAGRKVQKIKNIVWVSPIVVQNSKPKEVFIELKPSDATVRFEVFSYDEKGNKVPHSQGLLLYATRQDDAAEPEYIDLKSIQARCAKVIDGQTAYPLFKSFGLNLGPSFQVLQDVYKNENETLGVLNLPEFRQGELQNMPLHPSLVDGSLQAGMGAQLGDKADEMFVPFSIGEVEVLHSLQANCYSYVTEVKNDKKGKRQDGRVVKSNVLIVDETGKILVRISESTGVPLREVNKPQNAEMDGFAKLYYSYDWEKAALPVQQAGQTQHSIVLFDTDEILRNLYQERLRAAGVSADQVILVQPGESFKDLGNAYTINPQNKDDFAQLFDRLMEKQYPVENICFAWPVGRPDLRDEQFLKDSLERGVYSLLFICQSLIKHKLESKAQLLYLYSTKQDEIQPYNEAVSGFIKALRLEYPKLISKTLEVRQDSIGYDQLFEAITAELQARTQDSTAVRYEAQERYIKKLKSIDLEETAASQGVSLKENGVYLITGGAGGLGLIFAEFLAKQFKARLVLTGRSKLSVEQEAKLEKIGKLGAEVLYLPANVSNYEDVKNLVSESKARFGKIDGIIHAAGVLKDSLIRNKIPEEMSAVFAPKVYGTLHLDEATKDETLDFFVTFSSLAAVTGNAGQCDYSFANHFMDSFVAERELQRARGSRAGKTLTINWSLWADGGMKLDEQTEIYFKKTLGIMPLRATTGLEAFVKALASQRFQLAMLEGVQEKVEIAWGLKKKEPAPAPVSSGQAAAAPVSGGAGDLFARLQEDMSKIVMDLLKLDASDMSTDKILLDLGFDSIGLTTFANAVNEKYKLDLTPVLFFDYPSVGEIAKYLCAERESEIRQHYEGSASGAPAKTATPSSAAQQTAPSAAPQEAPLDGKKGWNPAALDRETAPVAVSGGGFSPELRFVNMPIAIVGMSGVMPQSEDLEEFWENLKNSKNMISVIPPDRWRWEDYYGDPLKEVNKSNSKWGGFMKEIDKFDPLFFGISPREAQAMDPQQRIFLEHVWRAIEDSGHKVSDLSGTKTGLFVGVATNDYIDVMKSGDIALDGYSASGNSHSVLANRVSFLLNLRGPSAPLDTACSSSLVALHRAIESIHTGSSDMAIVGGVQVMLTPAAYISFSMAGMLSDDGKCKTFDKRANGYVRGEGAGAIFLKPLAAAETDGDHIYAVIRATAENHGGKVTTLTAPNSSAQAALLVEAYEKAHVDPTTVGYIECHGTGTSLGDPIEIQSLSKAFADLYKKNNKAPASTPHCGLSSVKTNIGHLETAAGIASMLKVLLALKHKQIPANIHFEELNPYINLKGTPFYIADKLTTWEAPKGQDGSSLPRRAGVSSFGFGGANAHIVLEEYIPKHQVSVQAQGPQLIVLSAKNEDRLKAYVQSMHAYLEDERVELADFAYTLQVGRDEMPERLALVAASTEELKQKLEEIIKGERPHDSYRNNIRSKEAKAQNVEGVQGEAVQKLIEQKDLAKLAELWVAGTKVDWRLFYKSGVPRRISVPTYPFARERYWIPGAAEKNASTPGTTEDRHEHLRIVASALHPLIHRNVSTLEEQKFASRFTGEEFFFADHVVDTQKILPGVAYLEMARAAGELAGNAKVRIIRNLAWERPLIVGNAEEEVEISLTPVKNEIKFVVKAAGKEKPIVHCTGKLAYSFDTSAPAVLDIARIKERCTEEIISGQELYPLLSNSGLKLGKSFQIVQKIFANESESLAMLQLPEHLKKDANQFWLHPALMDGSLHTAIGLMKKSGMDIPLSIPYSVGEVQVFHALHDLYYGYATWAVDNPLDNPNNLKVTFQLLDKNGRVLVRLKDFVSRPVHRGAVKPVPREPLAQTKSVVSQDVQTDLQSLVPVWNPVLLEASKRIALANSTKILLLGGNQARLEWAQKACPNSQLLEFGSPANVEAIAQKLGENSFDQLLWIAPDVISAPNESADGERIIERQEDGVLTAFRIIKALQQAGYAGKKLQWTVVTSMTQPVTDGDAIHPTHAGIAGLIGSLAKECPHWDLRLLDVDSLASVTAQECLSLPWDKLGNELAFRGGTWFQQGLASMSTILQAAPVYRQNGVYVVIGGAGGLGEVWTRFMMEQYQANVVWIGRRKYDEAIEDKLINSLTRLGRAPMYVSADATNLEELEQAYQTILRTHPAIHGVIHSAIVLQDQSLARMEEPGFKAGLSAKVDVSVNMDKVFGKQELDFMLFFSSIISFFKTPGQANYSAGCTFKDSFAHHLQQKRAYPVKIMNWGYWGSVGVASDEFHRKVMERMGIGSIETQEGMASLQALVSSDKRQMVLIKTLSDQAIAGSLSEILTRHQQSVASQPAVKAKEATAFKSIRKAEVAPVAAKSAGMSEAYVQKVISEKLSEALKIDLALLPNDAPFAEYGVDSIIGVNLLRTLNETLKIELDPAKLFEYSTIEQLSHYIATQCQGQGADQLAEVESTSQRFSDSLDEVTSETEAAVGTRFFSKEVFTETSNLVGAIEESNSPNPSGETIAIIGMSGRFAESESLEEFWQNLKAGKDLVKEVSRWKAADCVISVNGHGYCSQGSFIEGIDCFDPSFFRISRSEAVYMDPQQRLFLEESWKALEDAGYAGKSVHEKQCGVYVGCGNSNYDRLFGAEPPAQAWWGNSQSVAPARIAYYLNLQGPAMAVDTACSSSLVAIHLACQGLWAGETEMALAGGVYIQATSGFHQVANRAGMLSPEGKCYSFDARANGFVPGEGVGVIVLKRLRDALQDGDHVYGVIAGSGINQNGSSNGLISPNAQAQERLERAVYERFKINPETIQVVEAHGTGTIVGDSLEYGAIRRVFGDYTDKKQFCAIGSVKTNVGHGATAAGITSVLKVMLALQHRQIPPSLHFEKGNPGINFGSGPFYVNTQLQEWKVEEKQLRRAAVSSFGFSGTNAHLVVEEGPAVKRPEVVLPGNVVVLSARTAEQLKQQVRNLVVQAKDRPGLSMNDLSYTLFVGRMHLAHRLSCVARNQEELIQLLEQWLATGAASQVYTSEIQEGKAREQVSLKNFGNYCIQECRNAKDAASYLENSAAIADLYIQGYSLDFPALFSRDSQRIPLPTYPFARERYWVNTVEGGQSSLTATTVALHPLLHTNTSTLSQQSYSSTFTGAEFFIEEHGGHKTLSGVMCLEMVRAAMEKATGIPGESSVVELERTVWGQPMLVDGSKQVTIALLAEDIEQINYEIYSGEAGQEMIHCQGRASFGDSASTVLDIDELQGQMQQSTFDADQVYADFAKMGVPYRPAHQTITTLYQGDRQLLARLCLPVAAREASVGQDDFIRHPSLLAGAWQAGIRLIANTQRPDTPLVAHSLERLCMLLPCAAEMFAWVRHSQGTMPEDKAIKLDIDLIDTKGNVCVQMRGLSFQADNVATEPEDQILWLFSAEQSSAAHSTSMVAAEKIELFLKQETALQLQKPVEAISTSQSYFDLGLTSQGIASLIQKLNQLLGINLLPGVLFEYRDIRSLAGYLAEAYWSKIDALFVTRERREQSDVEGTRPISPANLTPLPRKKYFSNRLEPSWHSQSGATIPEREMYGEQVLEKVLWQEESLDESYEKVAF